MLLVYLSAYMTIAARVAPAKISHAHDTAYYVIGSISPITQLLRASMSGLNLFSLLCQGSPPAKASYGGEWTVYGAPIMFLILQSLLMFGFLVWSDHRYSLGPLKRKKANVPRDPENNATIEPEVAEEEARVLTSDDGLRVIHIDKTFKPFMKKPVHAVENLTFGVKQGEVFALVGPNGGTWIIPSGHPNNRCCVCAWLTGDDSLPQP
jgi:ATP-binding cassette subfamily A (ABC1) protein 3